VKWKENISRFVLRRYKDNQRERQGCNLRNAESVGLIYLDRDHRFYRQIKDIAKHLHEELGVKTVAILSYVPFDSKKTPGYLVKKLNSGYFCKSDLNWYGKPVKEINSFIEEEFDILFDLELEPILPLKYILKKSMARMKVGPEQKEWDTQDYDVTICRIEHNPEDGEEVVDQMLVWQEQTERTFKFISEVNIK
tara:strand:+ start:215 stop:796 length:582 start_codon:yes stop_codon:yes gene_type:complete